ncbi:MAG: ATP cone domain-containing protein [Vicinamibacterales bacterium]
MQYPDAASTLRVIKRSGAVTEWDPGKISAAIARAFLAVEGPAATGSSRIHDIVATLTAGVAESLTRRADAARALHIEDIQDQVELALMRAEHHKVARAYVLYREARAEARRAAGHAPVTAPAIEMTRADGSRVPLDEHAWRTQMARACDGLADVSVDRLFAEAYRNIYDGVPEGELRLATVMAARALIDVDPDYTYVAARLLLDDLACEATALVVGDGGSVTVDYARYFPAFITKGIELESARTRSGRFRSGTSRGGAPPRARPAVPVPRIADAVRPVRSAQRRHALRAAAGVLHARRNGARVARARPQRPRDSVLRISSRRSTSCARRRRCSTRGRAARSSRRAS